MRDDKPVTTLETRICNQDGAAVLEGTAVVWRDPVVASRRNLASAPARQTPG
jgi:hypothetical protein